MRGATIVHFDEENARKYLQGNGPGWYFVNHETQRAEGPYPSEADAFEQGLMDTTREEDES